MSYEAGSGITGCSSAISAVTRRRFKGGVCRSASVERIIAHPHSCGVSTRLHTGLLTSREKAHQFINSILDRLSTEQQTKAGQSTPPQLRSHPTSPPQSRSLPPSHRQNRRFRLAPPPLRPHNPVFPRIPVPANRKFSSLRRADPEGRYRLRETRLRPRLMRSGLSFVLPAHGRVTGHFGVFWDFGVCDDFGVGAVGARCVQGL